MTSELTVDEIELARVKILENGSELIQEAGILLVNRSYARSVALSLLAFEELSKIPIIVSAGGQLARGKPVNWKRVHSRMRNHSAKVRMALSIDPAVMVDPPPSRQQLIAWQTAKQRAAKTHNEKKNAALYSDLYAGVFIKPSDRFDRSDAERELEVAKSWFRVCELVEKEGQGSLEADSRKYEIELEAIEERLRKAIFGA